MVPLEVRCTDGAALAPPPTVTTREPREAHRDAT